MSNFFKEEESGPTTFLYNAVETVTGKKGFRVKANKSVTNEFNVESSGNT